MTSNEAKAEFNLVRTQGERRPFDEENDDLINVVLYSGHTN